MVNPTLQPTTSIKQGVSWKRRSRSLLSIMLRVIVVSCLLAAASAAPSLNNPYVAHGYAAAPQCEQICNTVVEQACQTVPRQACQTAQEQQCTNVVEQQCTTVPRQACTTVTDQVCNNVPEQQCTAVPRRSAPPPTPS